MTRPTAVKFTDEDLNRWKREISPIGIIGSRVPLRRDGKEYAGLCPFHPDKNPSFKVYKLDDAVWGYKCFGCGESGNLFQFIQKFDALSFNAAVEKVLSEAGIAGWQDGQEQAPPPTGSKSKKIATFTMAQYSPAIAALEKSTEAQKWLADRGIGMDVSRKFCLGFVQSAEKISPNNLWVKDGWILFPTLSEDRQTVTAVKYRSLVAKKAKKSGKGNSGILRALDTDTTLFNLQAVDPQSDVWVVEGEPDTLVMAQAGYVTVGLPMSGYKPTEEEIETLLAARRVFLAGDTDKTGIAAMTSLQNRLNGSTFVIRWPNGRKDANDVFTKDCGNDIEKFRALVEDRKSRAVQTRPEAIIVRGDQIQVRSIRWLWNEKIPLGKITLMAGNPDNGKSLAATSIAATCSTGGRFPGSAVDGEPADVLMLLGEDDLDDTAVPRLIAANANLKRIHFIQAVRPTQQDDREVRLDFDIPAIEAQLENNPAIRLVIIDPISNYLGDISMVAEQEVRSILIPLKRAAEKFKVAVVIVMHLNKKTDLEAISRVGGAMAFIGVARCSWLFARNVQEKTEETPDTPPDSQKHDTFSMLRIKNNLVSATRAGLSYSVAVRPVLVGQEMKPIPYVVWGDVIEGSADDALGSARRQVNEPGPTRGVGRPNDALQRAIHWLEGYLQDNKPKPSVTLIADAKNGAGISVETLRRAKEKMGVADFKQGKNWFWRLLPMNEQGSDESIEEVSRQRDLSLDEETV